MVDLVLVIAASVASRQQQRPQGSASVSQLCHWFHVFPVSNILSDIDAQDFLICHVACQPGSIDIESPESALQQFAVSCVVPSRWCVEQSQIDCK
jgi:hypothetical protein